MMKHFTILVFIFFIAVSCDTKRDIDLEIRNKITEFYKVAEVKDYKPISYSKLDTIQNLSKSNGTIIRLTGKITHVFLGRSNDGNITQYTNVFDVTIFENDVIVIPRGY